MVFESQRSRFQKVKAIPARGCIDWNRCSSASRPPLFADGISSKKIMISLEQTHTSWNALHFDDFLSIVCWTGTYPPFEIFVFAKQKQHLDSRLFDMFMTKLSIQCRIIILSDNSKYLSCFFSLEILAVVFSLELSTISLIYHIFEKVDVDHFFWVNILKIKV